MITPPFISACLSMMESEVGEPRRVEGPTRHGGAPIRRDALFLGVLESWNSSHVVLEAQRVMAESQYDVARSFYLLSGSFSSLGSSHVVLEAQRVMAGSQCDMACSFCALFGCFGAFGLVPRRVGGPTRHGGLPIRRGRAQYNVTRLFLGTSTKKATSELSQRWQA